MKNIIAFFKNKSILLASYVIINALFVLKYSTRIDFINPYVCTFLFSVSLILVYQLLYKYNQLINKIKCFNNVLIISVLVVFLSIIVINYFVDGLSLNSDRWSALEVLIGSVLEGEYPYAVLDHLDNTTSNLPGLFYIGLPFYLLGDVGYLQAFVFLLLGVILYKTKIKNHQKMFLIFLIVLSPAYFWEVFAKSDLISNTFLVLIFIYFWQEKYQQQIFSKYKWLAFFVALFTLTRGTVVIPLALFLARSFCKLKFKMQLLFVFFTLFFALIISSPILINLPDFAFIKEYNPFNHQTRYAPNFLIILSLLTPFVLSFSIKNKSDVFLFTTYILMGLLFATFILNAIEEGFNANLYGSLFDISYLSLILPSIFFYFLQKFRDENANDVVFVK